MLAREHAEDLYMYNIKNTFLQDAQHVRPIKAAGESKPEAYHLGYVEDFDEPRTM